MAYGTVNTDIVSDSSGGRLAPISSVFRNRIINGAMVIDQRNAGASVTASGSFPVDRFKIEVSQASKVTWQQNAGSVTPPTGFRNYAGATSSSAYSVVSGDYFIFEQQIEGYNVADLMWGTANAQTITLSFWVRSSLTGTFGGAVSNNNNRSYPFTYTINSANTWEQKSVTIIGDTSGTWNTTNGCGMFVNWSLGTGSTYSGTAGAWTGSLLFSATGATSVVGTNGATFYITGVQLEVGSSATGFEYRQYGQELALCQRYYSKSYATETAAGTATVVNSIIWLTETTNSYTNRYMALPVTMRASPTVVAYSPATGASGKFRNVDTATDITANVKNTCIYSGGVSVSTANELNVHWTASAEL